MHGINLILLELPPSPTDDATVGGRHSGKLTACAGFFQAMLDSDAIDRIIVHSPRRCVEAHRNLLTEFQNGNRVELLDSDELDHAFSPTEKVIVQSYTPSLRKALHLRWLNGSHRWPVAGMTHDLSSIEVYDELLLTLLGRPRAFDAITCSTRCAQGVMERLLDRAAHFTRVENRMRLPIVPLGLNVDSVQAESKNQSRRLLDLPADDVLFLYLGRISHAMKADLLPLVRAFHHVRKQIPTARLVVAGGVWGDPEQVSVDRLQRFIQELDLSEATSFFLNISAETRNQLFAASDVFVSPADSFQESFGMTLLEAMAAGLPIIASDFDGYRDVLGHSGCGILVETTSPPLTRLSQVAVNQDRESSYECFSQAVAVNVDQLSDAMLTLAQNPQLRTDMAIKGTRHVREHYDWPVVMRQHLENWSEQLQRAAHDTEADAPSPYWYDYGQIFAEHTSRKISDQATFVLRSPLAPDSVLLIEPPCDFDRDVLEVIIETLRRGPVRVRDLPIAGETALRYMSYLLKHGVAKETSLTSS